MISYQYFLQGEKRRGKFSSKRKHKGSKSKVRPSHNPCDFVLSDSCFKRYLYYYKARGNVVKDLVLRHLQQLQLSRFLSVWELLRCTQSFIAAMLKYFLVFTCEKWRNFHDNFCLMSLISLGHQFGENFSFMSLISIGQHALTWVQKYAAFGSLGDSMSGFWNIVKRKPVLDVPTGTNFPKSYVFSQRYMLLIYISSLSHVDAVPYLCISILPSDDPFLTSLCI